MNRVFATRDLTEDQDNAHLILHLHVASRSAMLLSAVGSVAAVGAATAAAVRRRPALLFRRLARYNAAAAVLGPAALGPLMTEGRMRGRAEIEWQDRSWRILLNRGQNAMDTGSAVGAVVGAAVVPALLPASLGVGTLTAVLAGAAIGNLAGGIAGVASLPPKKEEA
ncbi:hypothetical protein HK405_015108 [Cladochytrium tenue]|nr:hypothetical protein HK405_015108 [Cladochytrium tenue]